MLRRGLACLVICFLMAACTASEPSVSTSSPSDAPPAVMPEDWMQRGYDGARSGYNPAEHELSPANIDRLAPAWQKQIRPDDAIWIFDPGVHVGAVVGDRVFVSWTSDEVAGSHLAVLRADDGTTIWERWTTVRYRSFVGVAGSVAIVEGDGVRGLDAATGEPRWVVPRSWELAIDPVGETVFVGTRNHVTALAAAEGTERWSLDLTPRDVASGLFVDGTLVVSLEDDPPLERRTIGLDGATGATRWEGPAGCSVGTAVEGRIFTWCAPADGLPTTELTALSSRDGATLWTHALRNDAGASPIAGGGVVLASWYRCVSMCDGDAFGKHRGVLTAFDATTGNERWSLPATGTSSPPWVADAIAGGLVFVSTLDDGPGRVGAVSLRTGTTLWSERIGTEVLASVDAVARGDVYVTTAFGWRDPEAGTITLYRLPGS